jgi:hypothetical protein
MVPAGEFPLGPFSLY